MVGLVGGTSADVLAIELAGRSGALADFAERIFVRADDRLLIVVDQAEEVYTLTNATGGTSSSTACMKQLAVPMAGLLVSLRCARTSRAISPNTGPYEHAPTRQGRQALLAAAAAMSPVSMTPIGGPVGGTTVTGGYWIVWAVGVSPDDALSIAGGFDKAGGLVRLYDSGGEVASFRPFTTDDGGHPKVNQVSWSLDGRRLRDTSVAGPAHPVCGRG